jgi:hypothetical protein
MPRGLRCDASASRSEIIIVIIVVARFKFAGAYVVFLTELCSLLSSQLFEKLIFCASFSEWGAMLLYEEVSRRHRSLWALCFEELHPWEHLMRLPCDNSLLLLLL